MSVEVATRDEYEFATTNFQMARLMTLNVAPFSAPHAVNIVAIVVTRLPDPILELLANTPLPLAYLPACGDLLRCTKKTGRDVSIGGGGGGGGVGSEDAKIEKHRGGGGGVAGTGGGDGDGDGECKCECAACDPGKQWRHLRLARFVVGTDAPNDPSRGGAGGDPAHPDPQRTNVLQNQQFQRNLRELGIPYTVNTVIQLFNVESATGTPGMYRIFYSALVCAGVSVRAFYSGEYALAPDPATCVCSDGVTQFQSEVVSAFILVPRAQLECALAVVRGVNLTPPFDESQLCINVDNVLGPPLAFATPVSSPGAATASCGCGGKRKPKLSVSTGEPVVASTAAVPSDAVAR
jgi:hypothetical protein